MDILWSASTTMRNPERSFSFLKTLSEMQGEIWNEGSQEKFQILLIKNRFYAPTIKNLTEDSIKKLNDLNFKLTYKDASKIFEEKKYEDPPMRGRTSFDPLEKMGLASITNNRITVTELGKSFLKEQIDLSTLVFQNLLKFQLPNPLVDNFSGYDTKPFINLLKLIALVNKKSKQDGKEAVGISKLEFGVFGLSIRNANEVPQRALDLLSFRNKMKSISGEAKKKIFIVAFINKYLSTFVNPVKNIKEYTDNMIRYIRLTKYIYIRGNGYYIDFNFSTRF